MFNQNILILGGMGPQASLLLHKRLIEQASAMGANKNEDYPSIIHLSVPVPDFIGNVRRKNDAKHSIKSSLSCLWQY